MYRFDGFVWFIWFIRIVTARVTPAGTIIRIAIAGIYRVADMALSGGRPGS